MTGANRGAVQSPSMSRPARLRSLTPRSSAVAAGMLLVLCGAVCVLWVRSFWVADKVGYVRAGLRDEWFTLDSCLGTLRCGYTSSHPVADGDPGGGWLWQSEAVQPSYPDRQRLAFVYDSREGNEYSTAVVVPHGLIVAAMALAGTAALLRPLRWRRRQMRGCCPGCGYDLRATPVTCVTPATTTEGTA